MFSPVESKDGKESIVDDFMYGSNVATAHVYVRMGMYMYAFRQCSPQGLTTGCYL